MVKNQNIVLDEGKEKYVDESINMNNEDYNLFQEFQYFHTQKADGGAWKLQTKWEEVLYLHNMILDEPPLCKFRGYDYYHRLYRTRPFLASNHSWEKLISQMYDFMDKPRFIHKYMINISPNWKGEITSKMVTFFEEAILEYLGEGERWADALYTLESGGEGNFLHAHIVATPNRKIIKSVDTHINKGNHKYQFIKRFDKQMASTKSLEGYVGCCKGKFSIQKQVLRNPELISDKEDYLIESKKPEGHTNKLGQKYLNERRSFKLD